jgi:hypothetical protein
MRPRRSFSSSASVAAVIATLGRTRVWTAPSIDGGKGPVWHDMDPDISDRVFLDSQPLQRRWAKPDHNTAAWFSQHRQRK